MPGVFICYRRDDSREEAIRVAEVLGRKFGHRQVFLDIDDIELGGRWKDVIDDRLAKIDAFVPIIGPDWIDARDREGNLRLFNDNDNVRREISQALASGVAVIPVLVDGASMPRKDELPLDLRPLCEVNALVASSEDLGDELDRLARALKDDLTVRTVTARTGGALLYTWTAFFGFLAFTILMSIQSCVLFPAEGEPTENSTRPLGLAVVVVVFVVAFLLIVMIRRALRARRDARRVAATVMLYLIGPTLLVASIWLALTIDPNPG